MAFYPGFCPPIVPAIGCNPCGFITPGPSPNPFPPVGPTGPSGVGVTGPTGPAGAAGTIVVSGDLPATPLPGTLLPLITIGGVTGAGAQGFLQITINGSVYLIPYYLPA